MGGSGWGNKEQQYYTKKRRENARVEGGNLMMEARKEALMPGNDYTSARLVSRGKGGSQLYGRFEIRAQIPGGRGTWPAIWMLPDQNPYGNHGWPDNGEIDIMEHVGYDPNVIHATTHCKAYYFRINTQKTGITKLPDATTAFHVYSVEWTPETITAYIDGANLFRPPQRGHRLGNLALGPALSPAAQHCRGRRVGRPERRRRSRLPAADAGGLRAVLRDEKGCLSTTSS